jgi:hypothetical protein
MSKKAAGLHMWHQRSLPVKGPPPEVPEASAHDPSGWAAGSEEINDNNILWRQYVIFVDLYRYYIDLVWKASIWYYTTIGVSLAYFLAHFNAGYHGYLPLLLLFLGVLSSGVSLICARAIHYLTEMQKWLDYIATSLHLPGRPHVEFLCSFCRFTSGTLLLIAASCFAFFGYLQVSIILI